MRRASSILDGLNNACKEDFSSNECHKEGSSCSILRSSSPPLSPHLPSSNPRVASPEPANPRPADMIIMDELPEKWWDSYKSVPAILAEDDQRVFAKFQVSREASNPVRLVSKETILSTCMDAVLRLVCVTQKLLSETNSTADSKGPGGAGSFRKLYWTYLWGSRRCRQVPVDSHSLEELLRVEEEKMANAGKSSRSSATTIQDVHKAVMQLRVNTEQLDLDALDGLDNFLFSGNQSPMNETGLKKHKSLVSMSSFGLEMDDQNEYEDHMSSITTKKAGPMTRSHGCLDLVSLAERHSCRSQNDSALYLESDLALQVEPASPYSFD